MSVLVTKQGEVYINHFPGHYERHEGSREDILELVPQGEPMDANIENNETKKKAKGKKAKANGKEKPTKAPKKAKAAADATEGTKRGPKGPRGESMDGKRIRLLVKENPRRKDTRAWDIYALYKDKMLVNDFYEAGGDIADIRWDEKRKHIEVY